MSITPIARNSSDQPRRAWWRLHLFTIFVGLAVAFCLVLLVVPGELNRVIANPPANNAVERHHVESYEHGWPWLYAARTSEFWLPTTLPLRTENDIPWLYDRAWSWDGELDQWHPKLFAADIAVAIALLLSAIAVAEFWRRRRHTIWQFGLRAVLAATLFVSGICLWLSEHWRATQEEPTIVNRLEQFSVYNNGFSYCGPTCWAKLAGRNWGLFYHHAEFEGSVDNSTAGAAIAEELSKLPYLERLTLRANRDPLLLPAPLFSRNRNLRYLDLSGITVSDAEMEALSRISTLESLSVDDACQVTATGLKYLLGLRRLRALHLGHVTLTDDSLAVLDSLENLDTLSLWNAEIASNGLRHLSSLVRIKELSFGSIPITDQDLRHFAPLGQLNTLIISDGQIRGSGFQHLAGLQNLRVLKFQSCPIDDEGLTSIAQLSQLNKLEFSGSNNIYTGLRQLHKLYNLKSINLFGSGITRARYDELLRALPQIEIRDDMPVGGGW